MATIQLKAVHAFLHGQNVSMRLRDYSVPHPPCTTDAVPQTFNLEPEGLFLMDLEIKHFAVCEAIHLVGVRVGISPRLLGGCHQISLLCF